MAENILEVKGLRVHFLQEGGDPVRAVDGLSYTVGRGECTAIIGESGSGKTVSALSILRLISFPPGLIVGGEIWFDGQDLLKIGDDQIKKIRGKRISMIFQEPSAALNPVMTIGRQIEEALLLGDVVVIMSARPGHVKEILDVPFGRPRPAEIEGSPEFAQLRQHIWSVLRDEVLASMVLS